MSCGPLTDRPLVSDGDIEGMLPACHRLAHLHRHKIRDTTITGVEDLAQVAMIGVLKAARSWDGEGRFFGWAWRKAEHEIQHYLRDSVPGTRSKHGPLRVTSLDAEHGDWTLHDLAGVDAVDVEMRLTLADALNRLDPADRALLLVHVVGGVPQGEIAGQPGTAQVRVSKRVRRALAHLARTPEIATLRAAA